MKQPGAESVHEARWVTSEFKQHKASAAFSVFLGALAILCAGALMFCAGYLITRAAEMPWSIMAIHLPTMFARIFGVGKPVLTYFERLTSHDWIFRVTSNLREKLYRVIERSTPFFGRKYQSGDVFGMLVEDIGHLQNFYVRSILPLVVGWITYFVIIVALGFFSLGFALAMALLLGLIVFVLPAFSFFFTKSRILQRAHIRHVLYRKLTDNIMGVSDWIYAGRSDDYFHHHEHKQDEMLQIDRKLQRFDSIRSIVIQLIAGILIVLLSVWAGLYFGGTWGGSSVWIAAFVLGFFPLLDTFAQMSPAAEEGILHKSAITHLNSLSGDSDDSSDNYAHNMASDKTPPEAHRSPEECVIQVDSCKKNAFVHDSEKAKNLRAGISGEINSFEHHKLEQSSEEVVHKRDFSAESPLSSEKSHDSALDASCSEKAHLSQDNTLRIENVSYSFPETEKPVLENITLTIKPGERIAILGRSGAGKSTLSALIRGDIQPDEGCVLLEGERTGTPTDSPNEPPIGIPTARFGDDISQYIGVIQQKTYLFNMTLAENIRIGRDEASDEQIWQALEKVGLSDLVNRLPQGLDTLVDEGGKRFSGGEAHRIALARVLVQDPPIVILDEPMVGLDPVTEHKLLETILETTAGKTLIMITHHLQGISAIDQVVFIRDGTISMQGTPDELARTNTHFQQLLALDQAQ